MQLVHERLGHEVQPGDQLTSFRGETYYLRSSEKPHKPSSTGRVYVTKEPDGDNVLSYFPGVFSLTWEA